MKNSGPHDWNVKAIKSNNAAAPAFRSRRGGGEFSKGFGCVSIILVSVSALPVIVAGMPEDARFAPAAISVASVASGRQMPRIKYCFPGKEKANSAGSG
ncbi:MAG: hypothetical protein JW913_00620 [Chitinispirillaceae bacterium]|nr:hypothetical protein [Chitinispirillaceae bacterium]